MNAAREKVRVAKALAELPKIDKALCKGELSYSKVRAMTRIADAVAEIAETYMNNDESSGSTADRYQVVVHVTAETSRRIACDSTVVNIKEDENGEPLSIGRRSRSIPPPMRRAIE